MKRIVLVLSAIAVCFSSAEAGPSAMDEKTRIKVVEYMLKTPLGEASPSVVEPFLTLDASLLPARLREKAAAKQIEVRTLLKIHDTKKKGSVLQPIPSCTAESGIRHPREMSAYQIAGFGEVFEDELRKIEEQNLCTETDMVCQFSLTIFYDAKTKKPRRLFLSENDPLMALVAAIRGKNGGQPKYFGIRGFTCSR